MGNAADNIRKEIEATREEMAETAGPQDGREAARQGLGQDHEGATDARTRRDEELGRARGEGGSQEAGLQLEAEGKRDFTAAGMSAGRRLLS